MKKLFNEFKKFINRGNVMDLAVAFIMGAAFKTIVSSLVNDIVMPLVSLVVGEQGFENYKYVITAADETNGILENAIYYGRFIQSILDFFIVAFVVFLMVRSINKAKDLLEKPESVEEVVAKPKVEDILLDIKTLLEDKK